MERRNLFWWLEFDSLSFVNVTGNDIHSDRFPDALIHSKVLFSARFFNDSSLLEAIYPNILLKFTVHPQIPRKHPEFMPFSKSTRTSLCASYSSTLRLVQVCLSNLCGVFTIQPNMARGMLHDKTCNPFPRDRVQLESVSVENISWNKWRNISVLLQFSYQSKRFDLQTTLSDGMLSIYQFLVNFPNRMRDA